MPQNTGLFTPIFGSQSDKGGSENTCGSLEGDTMHFNNGMTLSAGCGIFSSCAFYESGDFPSASERRRHWQQSNSHGGNRRSCDWGERFSKGRQKYISLAEIPIWRLVNIFRVEHASEIKGWTIVLRTTVASGTDPPAKPWSTPKRCLGECFLKQLNTHVSTAANMCCIIQD